MKTFPNQLLVALDDKKSGRAPKTFDIYNQAELTKLNEENYGIFFTVNSFDATPEEIKAVEERESKAKGYPVKVTKRRGEFLKRLNAVYGDLDVAKSDDNEPQEIIEERKQKLITALNNYCPPSTIIVTRNGVQPIWFIEENDISPDTLRKYRQIINGLIEWSKQHGGLGDDVKDVTRVLRVPGFYHQKREPYLITELAGNDKIWTLEELAFYFWKEPKLADFKPLMASLGDNPLFDEVNKLDIKQVAIDVWKYKGSEASFNEKNQLIVDGKLCATFVNRDGKNFISKGGSSDYPAQGNAITYVAGTLGITNKDSFKWLLKQYNIKKEGVEGEAEQEVEKKANQLVNLVLESGVTLFHDQFKEPHAALCGNGKEILKLNSKSFKRWLAHQAWIKGLSCGGEMMKTAIRILEGKAYFESPQYLLKVRIAKEEKIIWYDLGGGKLVKISPDGWEVTENIPMIFRHLSHQKNQVEPVSGGNLNELLNFTNIKQSDPEKLGGDLLLAIVALVAGFIPDFPHPILVLYGPQGAAKTTLARLFKELIDPSVIKTITMPDDIREFIQLVSHHWFIPFDNLTKLRDAFSDALCRAVTGDGFSKRELYSDDDDIIYEFQRFICLNGINLAVEKADLLDRSLIIGLERITKFEEEAVFWKRFEEAKPRLLGAIFDVLVKSLREKNNPLPAPTTRMADFMRWGCAIARALGCLPETFIEAYQNNIQRQNEEALEASPIAVSVLALMERKDIWEGTPTELLSEFNEWTEALKIDTKSRMWPKDARWLWRRIQEAKTNLEANDILVTRSRDSRRTITIQKIQKNDVGIGGDDGDIKKKPI